MRKYSRLAKTEKKKNIRRAIYFSFLSIIIVTVFFFFGLPTIVKFSAFVADIKKGGEPVERSDSTPPPPPQLDPLPEFTNDPGVEIKGSTEPGATLILFVNSKEEEVLANKSGEFIYSFSLNTGINKISALAKDTKGNESQKSETIKITFDDEAPELEITKPEDGGQYYGSKQRQIAIEGSTEEDAIVYINERFVFVDDNGTFTFTTTLSEGENTFTIKAEDKAGNSTEESLKLNFIE